MVGKSTSGSGATGSKPESQHARKRQRHSKQRRRHRAIDKRCRKIHVLDFRTLRTHWTHRNPKNQRTPGRTPVPVHSGPTKRKRSRRVDRAARTVLPHRSQAPARTAQKTNPRLIPMHRLRNLHTSPPLASLLTRKPGRQPLKKQVNHRRRVQSQHLADNQSTNDRDAERLAQFRSDTRSQGQR